jgi:4-hydroxybenzoate polyprenyltransferase
LREIIKDIEDFEGDTKADMRTLPIVIGKNKAKTVLFVLSFIPLLAIVYYVITFLYKQQIAVGYFLLFVVAPLLYFSFKILSANTQKKLHHLSNVLKLILFFGVLSLLLYKFKFIYIN